jgi:hypothetical protein
LRRSPLSDKAEFFTPHSFQAKFASDVVKVVAKVSIGAPLEVTEYVGKCRTRFPGHS